MHVLEKAVAVMNNLLSVIATMVLVGILSAKRFAKAVESNSPIPSKLTSELAETLSTCKEHTLIIPGALQAQAAQYSVQTKNTDKSDDWAFIPTFSMFVIEARMELIDS